MKKTKLLWLTSAICLSPIIMGLVLYGSLPGQVAVKWRDGVPINFLPRWVVVFLVPVGILAVHIAAYLKRQSDPKKTNHSAMASLLLLWVAPCLAVVAMPITYMIALGHAVNASMIISCLAGLVLIILGNQIPKSRQNYTLGVRFPWTLDDPDLWNRTNRVAGVLWVVGGIVILLQTFLMPEMRILGLSFVAMVVVTVLLVTLLYSYMLNRRKKKR